MCDFHNFGLIFAGQMHCLPQRLKSTLFEIFSNGGCPKGTRSVEKISNNVDFSLWGNRATTWEYFLTFSSETKIMKIRHSVKSQYYMLQFSELCTIFKKYFALCICKKTKYYTWLLSKHDLLYFYKLFYGPSSSFSRNLSRGCWFADYIFRWCRRTLFVYFSNWMRGW